MGNDLSNVTSRRINELRIKKNLTIEKLAELVGVSKATISKWENGYVNNMRQDKVAKLADIFGVSPTYILGYESPEEYYTNDETALLAQWLYEHEEMRLLFDAAKDVNPDDLKAVHTLLLSLKQKEGGKSE
jgi:transcriptional regulator with XRE-family HTH domain